MKTAAQFRKLLLTFLVSTSLLAGPIIQPGGKNNTQDGGVFIGSKISQLDGPLEVTLPKILDEAISSAYPEKEKDRDWNRPWVVPVYNDFREFLIEQQKQGKLQDVDLPELYWKMLETTAEHFPPGWHHSATALEQMEQLLSPMLPLMLANDSPEKLPDALAVAAIISLHASTASLGNYQPVLWSESLWNAILARNPGKEAEVISRTIDAFRSRMRAHLSDRDLDAKIAGIRNSEMRLYANMTAPKHPLQETLPDTKAMEFMQFVLILMKSPKFSPSTKKEILSMLELKISSLNQNTYFFKGRDFAEQFKEVLDSFQEIDLPPSERQRFLLALNRDSNWSHFWAQSNRYAWKAFGKSIFLDTAALATPSIVTHFAIKPLGDLGFFGWSTLAAMAIPPALAIKSNLGTLSQFNVPNLKDAVVASFRLRCAQALGLLQRNSK